MAVTSDQEKILWRYAIVINILKQMGVLTDALVAAVTGVDDLIADTYAALESSGTALYGPEARQEVRIFEQGIRYMQALGLIDDTIAAALTTVNTASASTDLRYLISNALTDTSLDVTLDNDPFAEGPWGAAVTA